MKVEKKHFFLKKLPPVFLIRFFLKKQVFILKKKTQKPRYELFYGNMHYHHFQNYTIITCYSYYGIQIWG